MIAIHLLRSDRITIRSEKKLFLAAFLACFGRDSISLPVTEMAKSLGVSHRIALQRLMALSGDDALIRVQGGQSEQGAVGRPRRCFQVTEKVLELDYTASFPPEWPKQALMVKQVLCGEGEGAQLCAGSRLILATLLAHADEMGVVRDLGTKRLQALTWMTPSRLAYRIQSLIDAGFIRHKVSGQSLRWFKEVRATSVYFLNLNHSLLCRGEDAHQVAVICSDPNGWLDIFDALPSTGRAIIKSNPLLINILRARLMDQTSFLLSNHWDDLDKVDAVEQTKLLVGLQSALEIPDKAFEALRDAPSNAKDLLENDLALACVNWAFMMKHLIREALPERKANTRVQLLPVPPKSTFMKAFPILLSPNPGGSSSCVVLSTAKKEPKTYESEACLELGERIRFGLLAQSATRG